MTKILFLNPNVDSYGRTPIGITNFSGLLKTNGHEVKLFDTTFFYTEYLFLGKDTGTMKPSVEHGFYQKTNLEDYGVQKEKVDIVKRLNEVIEEFQPDIITFSLFSCMLTGEDEYRMYARGLHLIDKCVRTGYKVVVGGIIPTLEPEKTIINTRVDIVCRGEGELAFLDLANAMNDNDWDKIKKIENLWVKEGGNIFRNPLRPLIYDLDVLPTPDFDIFEDRIFYRPYHGEVLRGIDFEFSRGCYHTCSYCVSSAFKDLYGVSSKQYRREKSVDKLVNDLAIITKKHKIQVIKFLDELFLGMSEDKLKIMSEEYQKKVGLPFMIETTIGSLTENKLKYLEEMGCINISLGVECGNDKFRKDVLKKNMSSNKIIEKIKLINSFNMDYSLFTIIGFPFETRDLIFDTINLYKNAGAKCVSCSYFQPFLGAELTKLCLEKGFTKGDEEDVKYATTQNSSLTLPTISNIELQGLMKTFMLYVYYPKFFYPIIKMTENDSIFGDMLYQFLAKYPMYKLKYTQNKYSVFIKRWSQRTWKN